MKSWLKWFGIGLAICIWIALACVIVNLGLTETPWAFVGLIFWVACTLATVAMMIEKDE